MVWHGLKLHWPNYETWSKEVCLNGNISEYQSWKCFFLCGTVVWHCFMSKCLLQIIYRNTDNEFQRRVKVTVALQRFPPMGVNAHNNDKKPIWMQKSIQTLDFLSKLARHSSPTAVAAFTFIIYHKSLAHWSPAQERIYIHKHWIDCPRTQIYVKIRAEWYSSVIDFGKWSSSAWKYSFKRKPKFSAYYLCELDSILFPHAYPPTAFFWEWHW